MLRTHCVTGASIIASMPMSATCHTPCHGLALFWPGAVSAAPPLKLGSCERRQRLCRWPPSMPRTYRAALPKPTPLRRTAECRASCACGRKTVHHVLPQALIVGQQPCTLAYDAVGNVVVSRRRPNAHCYRWNGQLCDGAYVTLEGSQAMRSSRAGADAVDRYETSGHGCCRRHVAAPCSHRQQE